MVGVGRGYSPDTGSGAELYTVIGHAPRHLDRNIALVGRVVEGIEHLSSLPRGTGDLGFYEDPDQRVPIERVRLGSDMADPPRFEYLSTEERNLRALRRSPRQPPRPVLHPTRRRRRHLQHPGPRPPCQLNHPDRGESAFLHLRGASRSNTGFANRNLGDPLPPLPDGGLSPSLDLTVEIQGFTYQNQRRHRFAFVAFAPGGRR